MLLKAFEVNSSLISFFSVDLIVLLDVTEELIVILFRFNLNEFFSSDSGLSFISPLLLLIIRVLCVMGLFIISFFLSLLTDDVFIEQIDLLKLLSFFELFFLLEKYEL